MRGLGEWTADGGRLVQDLDSDMKLTSGHSYPVDVGTYVAGWEWVKTGEVFRCRWFYRHPATGREMFFETAIGRASVATL